MCSLWWLQLYNQATFTWSEFFSHIDYLYMWFRYKWYTEKTLLEEIPLALKSDKQQEHVKWWLILSGIASVVTVSMPLKLIWRSKNQLIPFIDIIYKSDSYIKINVIKIIMNESLQHDLLKKRYQPNHLLELFHFQKHTGGGGTWTFLFGWYLPLQFKIVDPPPLPVHF